ncbi:enoyl-CoA hydratase-related protein [Crocinitomicaceae bacterium]|jgi:enoyl-CoA hydratase|nr:enoyl-CoA hydratase-related protein [Crocinitomicaceae bacterium]MDB4648619.1 enoyl-CoA hydratase-related protein [Crocinitomicaceae bacterium]
MFENIALEISNGICILTINRPKQLNALNKQTIEETHKALKDLEADHQVGVVILTGAEDKAFVAGADIKEFADFSIAQGGSLAQEGQKLLFDYVEHYTKPIIAAVNGFALGGGLELAMCAHIRVASSNAKMGLPEVSLGVIPGYGGTQRLAQLVGKGKANEMIFTAGMISAEDAFQSGLVNAVVPQSELIDTTKKMASKILRNSPMAIRSAIKAVNAGFTSGINGYQVEIEEFAKCFGTDEFKEGTTAFLEKRKANFRK